MITIKFPNGNTREYEKGISALGIAKSISEGLARKIISAEVNNTQIEITSPINEDSSIKLFSWEDEKGKEAFWHSSAHILAQTIEYFYPKVKLTIGPSIENGFYYDVDLGDSILSEKDFKKLEDKFLEFAREKSEFRLKKISKKRL